ERVETVLETPIGPVTLVQVAGTVARRIVTYRAEGDRVKKGQRIGMIRFGSRVEVTLPGDVRFVVRPGDRVRAGETTVAEVGRGLVR
ncbi:MAG TPA: phosphatidylserine decarboxylase, partial [Thermoplasmata archaeon]|nr:phosphatidylserine decarboxylase [Thermoplasmata archaeon]